MKACDTGRNGRHTFHILGRHGRRKDDLLRSFIKEVIVCYDDETLRLDDDEGSVWQLYAEAEVLDAFATCLDVKCVVSFQSFRDGEMIAVARKWKPAKNKAQANTDTGARHAS